MKIAMIEDDTEMAELICEFLAKYNITVDNYETPHLGLSAVPEEHTPIFTVDIDRHEIKKNDESIYLTNAEFEILAYFIKKKGFVVSREELLTNVESINYESSLKSIDVMIGRIRTKIETIPKQPEHLISIRGLGYKLINE